LGYQNITIMPFTTSSKFIAGLITFARNKKELTLGALAEVHDYIYQWKIEKGVKRPSFEKLDLIIAEMGHTQESFWGLVPEYLEHLNKKGKNDSLTARNKFH
jgi:hypothetical protein